ncbi:hypothetical protein C8Q77DRAFT_678327 [Trametes polyzona]|nr:hypothetical protein C8Q77DRAFT_678327 [Trametes polyzona]
MTQPVVPQSKYSLPSLAFLRLAAPRVHGMLYRVVKREPRRVYVAARNAQWGLHLTGLLIGQLPALNHSIPRIVADHTHSGYLPALRRSMQYLSLPRPVSYPIHVHGNLSPSPTVRVLQHLPGRPLPFNSISSGVQSRPSPRWVTRLRLLAHRLATPSDRPTDRSDTGPSLALGCIPPTARLCPCPQAGGWHSAKGCPLPFRLPTATCVIARSNEARTGVPARASGRGEWEGDPARKPTVGVGPPHAFAIEFPARASSFLNVNNTRAPSLLARRPPSATHRRRLPQLAIAFLALSHMPSCTSARASCVRTCHTAGLQMRPDCGRVLASQCGRGRRRELELESAISVGLTHAHVELSRDLPVRRPQSDVCPQCTLAPFVRVISITLARSLAPLPLPRRFCPLS